MADRSRIEWTDSTWNPITGCSPVSAGCDHCYAARMVKRFPHLHGMDVVPSHMGYGPGDADPYDFSRVNFHPDRLDIPLRWKKPRRIFVCSMGDLFHEDVSVTWLENILATVTLCPQHTFMVLTKRAERLGLLTEDRLRISRTDTWPIRNLWLGVTVENQEIADARIPILMQTPAAKRFVSVEPCLSDINFKGYLPGLNWIILGQENGPGKRPMNIEWARSVRDQCQASGVPFFFRGGTLDGKEWHQFPTT